MKLNYKNSKKIGTILGIILFIGLIAGITYAVFNWRSTNTNISVNTKCFQVEGSSSYTVQGSNMLLFDEDDIIDEENGTITYKNGMLYYPFIVSRDSSCNSGIHYEIIVHVTELSEDYRNGALKYKVIGDMSSYTSQQIANPLNENLSYNYFSNSIINVGTYTIYQRNISSNTSITPAVVFYLDGDLVPENASDLTLSASIEVVATQGDLDETAAEYIKFLYDNANKTSATVNSITYNLAPSVNLMNDRHASMSIDINGGDIRFYGANPNNYVWLGDTYTSTYTFISNGSSITRNVGDKKLWRIIGIFDGRLKLISNDPISSNGLAWDSSANTINAGHGINQWGETTYSDTGNVYEGADLMRLLNPGYENNQDLDKNGNTVTVNNSLYWNKGTGTVYVSGENYVSSYNESFANTGLSSSEQNMIDTATWYLGGGVSSYVNEQYLAERRGSTLGNTYPDDNDFVVRTAIWNGKVGLMYPSDYGYATDLSTCMQKLSDYDSATNSYACRTQNWIFNFGGNQWTICSAARNIYVSIVYSGGNTNGEFAGYSIKVRPAVYLKSGVIISEGNGSQSNPYVLNG